MSDLSSDHNSAKCGLQLNDPIDLVQTPFKPAKNLLKVRNNSPRRITWEGKVSLSFSVHGGGGGSGPQARTRGVPCHGSGQHLPCPTPPLACQDQDRIPPTPPSPPATPPSPPLPLHPHPLPLHPHPTAPSPPPARQHRIRRGRYSSYVFKQEDILVLLSFYPVFFQLWQWFYVDFE